jgi:hypothetical protein
MDQPESRALPPDIELVRDRIEEWRRTRERRTRMPEELWQSATDLAREHGAWRVARALRVRHDGLKQRLAGGEAGTGKATSTGFVDLGPVMPDTACASSGRGDAVVEMTRADGARLTVRLPARAGIDVQSLVASFCRASR